MLCRMALRLSGLQVNVGPVSVSATGQQRYR
jgi:hypothetical protein